MKNLLVVTIFSCLFSIVTAASAMAEKLNLAESINKAGQQRMLSQRIAKNYLSVTFRVNASDAVAEMKQSISIFEQNLDDLRDSINSADVKLAFDKEVSTWEGFKQFVLNNQVQAIAEEVIAKSDELLAVANQLVLALEASSERESAHLINISGRQRMLSQRIALYYLASYVGFRQPNIHSAFYAAVEEFGNSLKRLESSSVNTHEIASALNNVDKQWQFYQGKFQKLGQTRYIPRVIRVITEEFLTDMDKITILYQRALS